MVDTLTCTSRHNVGLVVYKGWQEVDIHLGDDDVSSSSLWLVEPEELYVERNKVFWLYMLDAIVNTGKFKRNHYVYNYD